MWKEIISLFRSEGPLQEAFDEALLMLRTSHDMFDTAVANGSSNKDWSHDAVHVNTDGAALMAMRWLSETGLA